MSELLEVDAIYPLAPEAADMRPAEIAAKMRTMRGLERLRWMPDRGHAQLLYEIHEAKNPATARQRRLPDVPAQQSWFERDSE